MRWSILLPLQVFFESRFSCLDQSLAEETRAALAELYQDWEKSAVLNNVFNLPATIIGGKGSSNAGRGIIKVPQLARVQ